jgi:hypothetical protein
MEKKICDWSCRYPTATGPDLYPGSDHTNKNQEQTYCTWYVVDKEKKKKKDAAKVVMIHSASRVKGAVASNHSLG